jgi:hypothetical protein
MYYPRQRAEKEVQLLPQDAVDVGCGAADAGAAGACIRVAWALNCCRAPGRAPELCVLQACSAWPVVSTAGVSL